MPASFVSAALALTGVPLEASPYLPRDALGAAEKALRLKTGDAILAEGFLPAGKFFLGEHVAVVGFAPAKCPALNRDHNRSFFPSAPPYCSSGWREGTYKVNGGPH